MGKELGGNELRCTQMDLQRIQGKIEAMLAWRRQVVVDLRTQLADYRQENRRLEEEVERRRNASYR